jgi:hypothetical protein
MASYLLNEKRRSMMRRSGLIMEGSVTMKTISSLLLCTWILWKLGVNQFGGASWEYLDAYTADKDCKAELVKSKKLGDSLDYITNQSSPTHIFIIRKDKITEHYYCVPDTVDPREKPK